MSTGNRARSEEDEEEEGEEEGDKGGRVYIALSWSPELGGRGKRRRNKRKRIEDCGR